MILKEYKYELGKIERYNNRSLYINVGDNTKRKKKLLSS